MQLVIIWYTIVLANPRNNCNFCQWSPENITIFRHPQDVMTAVNPITFMAERWTSHAYASYLQKKPIFFCFLFIKLHYKSHSASESSQEMLHFHLCHTTRSAFHIRNNLTTEIAYFMILSCLTEEVRHKNAPSLVPFIKPFQTINTTLWDSNLTRN